MSLPDLPLLDESDDADKGPGRAEAHRGLSAADLRNLRLKGGSNLNIATEIWDVRENQIFGRVIYDGSEPLLLRYEDIVLQTAPRESFIWLPNMLPHEIVVEKQTSQEPK